MDSDSVDLQKNRPISTKINSLLYSRWSPRSMTGEPLREDEICALFEAARVAPSSYNSQPWRFVFVTKQDPQWSDFFHLLVDFNKQWCQRASMLVIVISKKTFDHNNKLSPTHSFDTGAAWMSLALEGASRGLVVHAMSGFSMAEAKRLLQISDDFHIEAMIAIGRRGGKELLPQDMQEKETPSGRKALHEIVFRGSFTGS